MALDSKMSCLCCDGMVLVDSIEWGKVEMPIALCLPCARAVPLPTIKVLYLLRSQVGMLRQDVSLMKKDIGRLFKAQQELEQALVA